MNPPYIPHTSLDGTLITGWSGPCEVLAHARFPVALPDAAHLAMLQGKSAWVSCFLSLDACAGETLPRRNVCLDRGQNFSFDPSRCRMRLDPRRPEVAHRIVDVLRARGHEVGHLLPVALGGRQGDVTAVCDWCGGCREVPPSSPVSDGQTYETCSRCDRDGRVVIPAADVSALTLAASVAGVEAGRGVVLGVVEPLDVTNCRLSCETYAGRTCYWTMDEATRNECRGPREIAPTFAGEHDGWCWGDLYGPETGQAAIARIYAAVHAAGWARLDPAAPFGVVVPFLNLENER